MRIYACKIGSSKDKETNKRLLDIISSAEELKENLSKDEFGKRLVLLHNYLRKEMNLPNKLFSLARNKDGTKAVLVFFDKEPDGNYYETFKDEKNGFHYIVV